MFHLNKIRSTSLYRIWEEVCDEDLLRKWKNIKDGGQQKESQSKDCSSEWHVHLLGNQRFILSFCFSMYFKFWTLKISCLKRILSKVFVCVFVCSYCVGSGFCYPSSKEPSAMLEGPEEIPGILSKTSSVCFHSHWFHHKSLNSLSSFHSYGRLFIWELQRKEICRYKQELIPLSSGETEAQKGFPRCPRQQR